MLPWRQGLAQKVSFHRAFDKRYDQPHLYSSNTRRPTLFCEGSIGCVDSAFVSAGNILETRGTEIGGRGGSSYGNFPLCIQKGQTEDIEKSVANWQRIEEGPRLALFEQGGEPSTGWPCKAVKTTPKRGGLRSGLEGRKTSQRLNDAGLNFVQALVV